MIDETKPGPRFHDPTHPDYTEADQHVWEELAAGMDGGEAQAAFDAASGPEARSEPPPGRRWCCDKEHSERYVSGYPVRPSLSEAWADHDAVLASVEPTPTGEPTWNDATEALQRHIEQGYAAQSPQVQQALVKALDALMSDSRAGRKAKR